jgi:uncharacterized zinc-type alcohol dehydrogenase-like protein
MNVATPQSAQQEKSVSQTAKAFAAQSPTSGLAPLTIRRRIPGAQDVQIDILYCGVCHSDLHQSRNEWQKAMPTVYPCVPGHEIVGRVVKIGNAVTKFKAADSVALYCPDYPSLFFKNCLRNVPVPTKWDNRRKFRVSYRMRPAMMAG